MDEVKDPKDGVVILKTKKVSRKEKAVQTTKKDTHKNQGNRMLSIEAQFKEMRIKQLESLIEEYIAYFHKHGHFKKVHPISGEVLRDTNGLPIQISVPNVLREINQLKETMIFSEGLDKLVENLETCIEETIARKQPATFNIPTINTFNHLFKKF